MKRPEKPHRITVSLDGDQQAALYEMLLLYRLELDPDGTLDDVISLLIQRRRQSTSGNGAR